MRAALCSYAGMLAVAKCGGPQIKFEPGRPDASVVDAEMRLPAPDEPLPHTVSIPALRRA